MLFDWLVFVFLVLLGYLVRPVSRTEKIIATALAVVLALMFCALNGWLDAGEVRHG